MDTKAMKQVINEILSFLVNWLCCFHSGQIKCYCLNNNTKAQGLLGALRIHLNHGYTKENKSIFSMTHLWHKAFVLFKVCIHMLPMQSS